MKQMEPQEFETLIAQCALGDQKAFAHLYESTSSRLNGIAFRILRNVESANEVLQEAFVQIWKNAGEYRAEKAEPMTWMASIVRYRAYDRLKFEKRRIEGAQIQADIDNFDDIEAVNDCLKSAGYALNTTGGEVKGDKEVKLEQSSTLADKTLVEFSDKIMEIPSCFYEFAKRYPLANGELYTGFVAASADKIFESTNAK